MSSIALVTSGLGPRNGGIGMVSEAVHATLSNRLHVRLLHNHSRWPRSARRMWLATQACGSSFRQPAAVVYEHLDLARMHSMVPFLRAIPYVVFLHGLETWRPLSGRHRLAYEAATVRIAVSHYTANRAQSINPWMSAPAVVWLGVRIPETPAAGTGRKHVVVVLGRMSSVERYKGHDEALDCWPAVRRVISDATLVFIGDGDDRQRLECRVKQEGISGVEFAGFVSDSERDRYLRDAAALLALSTGEGFGLANIEAVVRGTPVVALRGTVAEELLPDGTGSILLPDRSSGTIASAVTALMKDEDLGDRLVAAGARRVRECFSLEAFQGRLLQACSTLPLGL